MALIVLSEIWPYKEVADAIESLGNHRITITGGEPLLQEAAVVELIDELNRRKSTKLEDKPCTVKKSTVSEIIIWRHSRCT